MLNGTFITFEGIEGSGKSTQIKMLESFLVEKSFTVETSFEPGGTDIGMLIRQILKNKAHAKMDLKADMLLFMADRAQHLHEKIIPALTAGKIYISDRYYDSTRALQAARGLSSEIIKFAHVNILSNILPDTTFLLDIDVDEGLRRAKAALDSGKRNSQNTRFEDYGLDYHKQVRKNYLQFAKDEPDRFVIIDGMKSPSEVHQQIVNYMVGELTF